jgi:hypothetical protein
MSVLGASPDAVGVPNDVIHHSTTTAQHRNPDRGRRSPGRLGMRLLGVAAVLSLLAAVAGCGSGATTTSSSSPSAATSSMAPTSGSTSYPAGDQLRTSITDLTNTQLVAEGTNAIKAGVDQVQTDFDAVKAAAKDDYQAPVAAVQSALQDLQTAVANLGSGDATENLRAVGAAITTTGAASESLFTQLKTACGS